VHTNVNYTVVPEFIVQSESAEQIAEALNIVKDWNPEWCPPFFMIDYFEAEQTAINQVFPNSNVYLCDFHREQAWQMWVKNGRNGLSTDEATELLQLLRACAHASPPCIEQDLAVDHYHQLAVAQLQKSCVWKKPEVQKWLNFKWFGIPQVLMGGVWGHICHCANRKECQMSGSHLTILMDRWFNCPKSNSTTGEQYI